jgi:hypothetical protein
MDLWIEVWHTPSYRTHYVFDVVEEMHPQWTLPF